MSPFEFLIAPSINFKWISFYVTNLFELAAARNAIEILFIVHNIGSIIQIISRSYYYLNFFYPIKPIYEKRKLKQ
jgi:hypothetical protein